MEMNPIFNHAGGRSPTVPDFVAMSSAENTWGIPFEALEIAEKIGSGASGQVYRGSFQGCPVAVKESYCVMFKDATATEDFKKEATVLSKLKHPNIVSTFSFFLITTSPSLPNTTVGALLIFVTIVIAQHPAWKPPSPSEPPAPHPLSPPPLSTGDHVWCLRA
jgi:serine/threonine protein kinase